MTKQLKVRFVLPQQYNSEDECEPEMHEAFEHCRQYKMTASWIMESKCMSLNKLTKKDIFVFQFFSGSAFTRLSKMQCLVVGARCLSYCLVEGEQIPPGPHPIFTTAMRNLVVSVSGLSKPEKEAIREMVLWMGGNFLPNLSETSTHLVSNTVLSEKYAKAVEASIPVMQEQWVEAVWEASIKQNVSGGSSIFAKYKLPPFANIVVTSSGLSKTDRAKIEKLIRKYGGTFQGAFDSNNTDVVVLTKEAVGRDKYKTALQFNKICVYPEWVYASVEKGYSDNVKLYKVTSATTSSPICSEKLPNMTLDFSTISNVRSTDLPGYINETVSTADVSQVTSKGKNVTKLSRPSRDSIEDYEKLVDDISMEDVKKAGAFLDGACVYICGWSAASRRERLASVISRCGGLRYDPPNECVTHIICGQLSTCAALVKQALEVAHAAVPVHVGWLVDSVKAGSALDAAQYRQETIEKNQSSSSRNTVNSTPSQGQPSPTMKKSLQLLNGERPPVPLFRIEGKISDEADEVVMQYINPAHKVGESEDTLMQELGKGAEFDGPQKTHSRAHADDVTTLAQTKSDQDNAANPNNSAFSDTSEDVLDVFNDIRFELQGIEDEVSCEYKSSICSYGGIVVKPGHGGSYVVVPLDFDNNDVVNKYAEVVTTLWVDDCIIKKELLPVQYFHRPVRILHYSTPLKGLVLGISTYSGVERSFIDEVAKLLGAITQLTFCRRTTSTVVGSTHLICPEPTGAKYDAAVRWGLPAINVDWLLECVAEGKRVREAPFLIGNTKEPEWDEEDKESTLNSPHNITNKENEHSVTKLRSEQKEATPKNATPAHKAHTSLNKTASTENTPVRKAPLKLSLVGDGDLSPASRYIAMARQGLLGLGTQETPKRQTEDKEKGTDGEDELSPASRYIAMARQGLLCEEEPPKKRSISKDKDTDRELALMKTPTVDTTFSPNLSPTSKKRLLAIERGELPSGPLRTPRNPYEISMETQTSNSACSRPMTKFMSPDSRKQLWVDINNLPGKQTDVTRKDTPLNVLMDRFLNRYNINGEKLAPRKLEIDDDTETPAKKLKKQNPSETTPKINPGVDSQLRQLTSVLMGASSVNASGTGSAGTTPQGTTAWRKIATKTTTTSTHCFDNAENEVKMTSQSQTDTVGWEDLTQSTFKKQTTPTKLVRRFMISSNVDNRDEISVMIEKLGGELSSCVELDPAATHLLCSKPGRSEKVLGSIASRKWVLHPAYVVRSHEVGKFIDENPYEWGNPEAKSLPTLSENEQQLAKAVYRWRSSPAPPFAHFKIVLHMVDNRRVQLSRLIEAGGGTIIDASPPYSCIEATHCFVEKRYSSLNEEDLKFFATHRIPVCLPVFLNNFLVQDPPPDASQCVSAEYKALLPKT